MRAAAIILALSAAPAAAQDPEYCRAGDAPANTPLDAFHAAFDVAVTRLACGWEIAEDRLLIDRLRREGGCSDGSEIAAHVADLFAADFTPLQEALWNRFDEDAEVNAFCASLETCETFDDGGGYTAACFAALAAIND